jgi:phosphatidylglycerophosphatase C
VRTIAAFDFDETLSTRDNVVPFMRRVGGPGRFGLAMLAAAPALALRHRDAAKARAVRRIFAGRPAAAVHEEATRFAAEIVEHHLRDEAVARAAWHRAEGHELLIVTASFDVYVEPVAERLGFDAVLATSLEVGTDGRLTGHLQGPNVRGAEKAVRLDAWLAGSPATVWAYGDSGGDRELLARADHPMYRRFS